MNIAIVEDSSFMINKLIKILQELSYKDLAEYTSVADFLCAYTKQIKTHQTPDLILLDRSMLNGLSAEHLMQEVFRQHPTQTILVCGKVDFEHSQIQLQNIDYWFDLGAKGYLVKMDYEKVVKPGYKIESLQETLTAMQKPEA